VDAEKLMKGLSKAPLSKPKCYEPGSGPEEDDDESGLTPDQIGKYIFIIPRLLFC
jgi:hypothetical protein